MSEVVEKVAKKIKAEIETDRSNYHSHVDKDICLKFQSNTLNDVLSGILSLAPNVQHASPECLVAARFFSCLPIPQKEVLTVSENKKKLIQIIVETLIVEAVVPGQSRLIITGQEDTLVEIAPDGVVIRREDNS